jgi:DNA-binding transcriptional LysR family regulator
MNGAPLESWVRSLPPHLTKERLLGVPMVMVASPLHPLCAEGGPISVDRLRQHFQLVLTDLSTRSTGREFSVLSTETWRLADLGAKRCYLRAGLGWGGMSLDMVTADLAGGQLVQLMIDDPA